MALENLIDPAALWQIHVLVVVALQSHRPAAAARWRASALASFGSSPCPRRTWGAAGERARLASWHGDSSQKSGGTICATYFRQSASGMGALHKRETRRHRTGIQP